MLVFPQFVTAASALYPVVKRQRMRSVVNVLGDGTRDVFADNDGALVEWDLYAKGLTAAEWNSVESLYEQVSGSWQTFTFLDPTDNLLADSELLSSAAWTTGALVQLTPGVADPLGTTRATTVTNGGQNTGGVQQTLAVPGSFQYCLSAWVRSSAGSSVTLTAGASTSVVPATAVWNRVVLAAGAGSSAATNVAFGVELPAGGSADLFGLQVEAQLAASDYKMTGGGGVYSQARFAADPLVFTAQGTDVYDALIRIVSPQN